MKNEQEWPAVAGAAVVSAMIVVLALAIGLGPAFVADFLKGPAAAWVQAIGSIAAIGAGYWFGQSAHRQELQRDARQDILMQTRRIYAIRELLIGAAALDDIVLKTCNYGLTAWPQIGALAHDQLEQCRAVPIFDVPDPELIRHVGFVRQISLTYSNSSAAVGTGRADPAQTARWRLNAQRGLEDREKALAFCEQALARLNAGRPVHSGS